MIRSYQECCAEVVERWGGHVAKYMGDGVLAYFGWPQAHEDAAERAVHAGLALTEAVGKLATPAGQSLAARVGIATGLVMVGELIGEGAAQEQTVVGETPNLAARLQGRAAPDNVVISQATRKLVGGLFELEDLGPQRLRGFAEPLAAFRVEGEGRAEGRFEALNLRYIGPNLFLTADTAAGDGRFELVMVTEAERSRLLYYLDHWQDDRDRLAILPSRSGSRLQIEWPGLPLHIDDKLQPKPDAKPKKMAGMVEARIDGAGVRFLVPDEKSG